MQLLNETGMQAAYTMGLDSDGRESLVVVAKGSFSFPEKQQGVIQPSATPVPLIEADTFTGEPGFSAPLFEADFVPVKQACDVIVTGSAHAPNQKPVEMVQVGYKIGNHSKVINVFGERYWLTAAAGYTISKPKPFVTMPVTYDIAFGGVDRFHSDEKNHDAYMPNPVGKGFHCHISDETVDGTPAPQTEAQDQPITKPDGQYKPMSFGVAGRGWQPRLGFGGTYDDAWLDTQFPFLPHDFDKRYYQCAPEDQQIPFPAGGETVLLLNLTPEGQCQFTLPTIDVPVVFFKKKAERVETKAVLDTIVINADTRIVTLSWRASIELTNNIFEIPQVLMGEATKGWWRAQELGKTYLPPSFRKSADDKPVTES